MPTFPKDFLWGAATSSHQVEGNNTKNDWWQWEHAGKNISDGTVSGDACDHYNRYIEDFDLIEKAQHNSHRISLEWSRIEPEKGVFDQKEIKHYKEVLENLKKRNIKTFVTLHHFTNPVWFIEKGGWKRKDSADAFDRYAQKAYDELHDLVDFWITINEPMVYAGASFGAGMWPPQEKNLFSFSRVSWNMIRAHKIVYKSFHAKDKNVSVGIAKDNLYFFSGSSLVAKLVSPIIRFIWNHSFFFASRKYHDFIGLNYYFKGFFGSGLLQKKNQTPRFDAIPEDPKEQKGVILQNAPKDIYHVLMELKKYNRPVYITEHGTAGDDKERVRAIKDGLTSIERSMNEGLDVRGYLHWSLLDNFEWHEGKHMRFGLIEIDYTTQKRTPRKSFYEYANIVKHNRF